MALAREPFILLYKNNSNGNTRRAPFFSHSSLKIQKITQFQPIQNLAATNHYLLQTRLKCVALKVLSSKLPRLSLLSRSTVIFF
jgi:hypothetical protein